MELQTIVRLEKAKFQIDYTTRLMMLGSCFVENMGEKLRYYRFHADINPCGIVYNPMSVARSLELLLSGQSLTPSDLIRNEERWVSLDHHGNFADADLTTCLYKINSRLQQSAEQLRNTDLLVITWGTSWVYRFLENGRLVSNCHKFPATAFERFRLKVEDIVRKYTILIRQLLEVRPDMKIIFTVSPVRHWKDGAHGNQLSKSVLLLAIDHLVDLFEQVFYFPSYEIVMDELRDYRFYTEDMLHISPQGIEYIWEKFHSLYMTSETRAWMKRIDKINKTLLHRPADPDSAAYRELMTKTIREREQVERELKISFS